RAENLRAPVSCLCRFSELQTCPLQTHAHHSLHRAPPRTQTYDHLPALGPHWHRAEHYRDPASPLPAHPQVPQTVAPHSPPHSSRAGCVCSSELTDRGSDSPPISYLFSILDESLSFKACRCPTCTAGMTPAWTSRDVLRQRWDNTWNRMESCRRQSVPPTPVYFSYYLLHICSSSDSNTQSLLIVSVSVHVSFIVSGLTFRSLIHLEFIFVYGVRKPQTVAPHSPPHSSRAGCVCSSELTDRGPDSPPISYLFSFLDESLSFKACRCPTCTAGMMPAWTSRDVLRQRWDKTWNRLESCRRQSVPPTPVYFSYYLLYICSSSDPNPQSLLIVSVS
ncbi:unnamed protein product, partial [Rangifer tarandus platyrhynchus]